MTDDGLARRDPSTRRSRGLALLAHCLLVVGVVGELSLLAVVGPEDPEVVTWRLPFALLAGVTVVSGWIIAWKRPRNPIGWIMLAVGAFGAVQAVSSALGASLAAQGSPSAGWALLARPENPWTWVVTTGVLITQVPLLFPNGSLPSIHWRVPWLLTVAALAVSAALAATLLPTLHLGVPNPVRVDWGTAVPVAVGLAIGSAAAAVALALVSLILRYRRAGSTERAQLRWVYLAMAIIAGVLTITGLEIALFGDETTPGPAGLASHLVQLVTDLSFSLLPLAILFAVLRRGLYSVDRIISRTAAYATVTVTVVAVYVAIALVGAFLLPDLPSVGIALATLTSAALFLPLLRVVRAAVDRRFNRAQYDAGREVDAFGERIRTGLDPYDAGPALVSAVERTLEPASVGLWIAGGRL